MPSRRTTLTRLRAALDAATTHAEWLEAAQEHDRLTGAEDWRDEDESPHYDAALLRHELDELCHHRDACRGEELSVALTASLYRHLVDISAPELYNRALTGTKRLIGRYLDEVERCLRWLAQADIPGISPAARLERFEAAWKVYGRSALMLSGGATWGFYHLGVAKALFEQGLLPHIVSGASTGAMIGAGLCARTDAELADMFADTDRIRLDGLLPVGLRAALRTGAWLDPSRLAEVLAHNVGDATFAEAFARSGRALNIAVSPTRTRNKPRLLSHLTAPDVLVARAALASSALPGLFPPIALEARTRQGTLIPYVPGELWVDGSLTEDLPKLRMARLHNVNHFIVSQANPHVAPIASLQGQRGLMPTLAGLAGATARTQGAYVADLARRATSPRTGPLRQLADRAYALVTQDYAGDITIHPRLPLSLMRKVVANPTREDLAGFILAGQRATWPRLAMIDDHTRIGRVFRELVGDLRAQRTAARAAG